MGTWDVVSMLRSVQATAVLTIEPSRMKLSWKNFDVTADVGGVMPEVSFHDDPHAGTLEVTHANEALDLGDLPYALGGIWRIQGESSDRCDARFDDGLMTLDCQNLVDPLRSLFLDFDPYVRQYLPKGLTTAHRSAVLASSFGSLGGDWMVLTPGVTCRVKIEGKTFTADCSDDASARRRSTLTLTFDGGVASGAMNEGELSARRR